MKTFLFVFVLAVTPALYAQSNQQLAPDPGLLSEINQIKAIDNHSHPPALDGPHGEKDTDFDALPCDTGMVFILVLHLDPTHSSMMAGLLTSHTAMTVTEAADGMPIQPDCVYVIPPGVYLSIGDGLLRLTNPAERRGSRMPFDFFLRSLAQDCGARAVCARWTAAPGAAFTVGAIQETQRLSRLVAATTARMFALLRRLRRDLLMRNLRLQLFIFSRQVGIFLGQRVHSRRQIRVLLLNIRQLPLQLIVLLPSFRILTRRKRQSQTRRKQQTRYSVFPHSFSLSLGDWLRECSSVVAPSAPRHKPYPTTPSCHPTPLCRGAARCAPCPHNPRVLSRPLGAAPFYF